MFQNLNMSMRLCGFGSTPADRSLESLHELFVGTRSSWTNFPGKYLRPRSHLYYKNKCCLVRYFLSPPSPNMGVLGELGPGKSSPSKLGPLLMWQQIGPHTFLCRGRLGPSQFDPCIIHSFVLNCSNKWNN